MRWYDPRNGGDLEVGTVATVTGGGQRSIGQPPGSTASDWVVLVRRR
ncbi:MAG TPA: hypothetical protein VKM72_20700 [Thermoanaerobaculia bacterium]|nr:hypothetical protein [Thermoanaerobaculia bacterium]